MTALAIFPQPVRFLAMADLTKTRIDLPDDERGRAPDTIKRFDRLQRKLANPKLTAKERDAVLAELAQIENAPSRRSDEAWSRTATTESVALATLRGEHVTAEGSAWRVLDRDPLLSLARTGKITADQLETGQKVRDLYDRRAEDAGAREFDGMPSSAHNHEAFIVRAFTRAKACEMVGRIERVVAIRCIAEPASLTMLRVVCERGLSVTSQGKGRAFDRNAAALALALDIADDVLQRRA